jgi:hypothetical protein
MESTPTTATTDAKRVRGTEPLRASCAANSGPKTNGSHETPHRVEAAARRGGDLALHLADEAGNGDRDRGDDRKQESLQVHLHAGQKGVTIRFRRESDSMSRP